MSLSTTTPAVATARGRRGARLLVAAAAVLAAEALWVLAELGFGLDLRAPAMPGSPQPADIGRWRSPSAAARPRWPPGRCWRCWSG